MGTLTAAHVFRVTIIAKGYTPYSWKRWQKYFNVHKNHTKILSDHSTHFPGKTTFNLEKGRKPNEEKKPFT